MTRFEDLQGISSDVLRINADSLKKVRLASEALTHEKIVESNGIPETGQSLVESKILASGGHKRSKYGNVKTEYNGQVYDSKREANYAKILDIQKHSGKIKGYLRQVRFPLPGNIVYTCDFLIFYTYMGYEVVDVKGFKTKEYKLKKKLMKEFYGIEITEV